MLSIDAIEKRCDSSEREEDFFDFYKMIYRDLMFALSEAETVIKRVHISQLITYVRLRHKSCSYRLKEDIARARNYERIADELGDFIREEVLLHD